MPPAVVATLRGLSTAARAWPLLPVAAVTPYLAWTWQTGGAVAESQRREAATAARPVTGSTDLPASTGSSGLLLVAPDVAGAGGVPEGCPLDTVVVTDRLAPAGAAPLAAGESRGLRLVVAMPETGTDQDACTLAGFALRLTATGTELDPGTRRRTTR